MRVKFQIICAIFSIFALIVLFAIPGLINRQDDSIQYVTVGIWNDANGVGQIGLHVKGSKDGCVSILQPSKGDGSDLSSGAADILPLKNAQGSEIRKLLIHPNGINRFSSCTGIITIDARSNTVIVSGGYYSRRNFFPIPFSVELE